MSSDIKSFESDLSVIERRGRINLALVRIHLKMAGKFVSKDNATQMKKDLALAHTCVANHLLLAQYPLNYEAYSQLCESHKAENCGNELERFDRENPFVLDINKQRESV